MKKPDLVLAPTIAYVIAARDMSEGWFTGKKLSDFIKDGQPPDYVERAEDHQRARLRE